MRRNLVLAIALLLVLPLLYSSMNTGRSEGSAAYSSVALAQGDPPPMCPQPPCEPRPPGGNRVNSSKSGQADGAECAAGIMLVGLLLLGRMKA